MESTTFRAVTADDSISIEVTFNNGDQGEYSAETITEMCQILESISVNLRMALENPEIRNAQPVGGSES